MANCFDYLHECINQLSSSSEELKVVVDPEEWKELMEYMDQPMNYGETRRKSVKCLTKNGRKTKCYFCVCIMRTDQGIYELMCNT